MSGIKTAYSTAYYRLLIMVKSWEIGDVLSVETTCTILSEVSKISSYSAINIWSAMDPCVKKVQKIGIIPGFGGAGFSFGSELKKECTFFKWKEYIVSWDWRDVANLFINWEGMPWSRGVIPLGRFGRDMQGYDFHIWYAM